MNSSYGWNNDTKSDPADLREIPLGAPKTNNMEFIDDDCGEVASWARNVDHYDNADDDSRRKKNLASNILIGSLMIAAIIFAGLAVGLSVNPSKSPSTTQSARTIVPPTAAPTAKTSPVEPETVSFGDLIKGTQKPTIVPAPAPVCILNASLKMVPPTNDAYYYDQAHQDFFTVVDDKGEKCGHSLVDDNYDYTTEWCDSSGVASQSTLDDGSYGYDSQVASVKYNPSFGGYFVFYVDRQLLGESPTPWSELLDTNLVINSKDATGQVTNLGTFSKSTNDPDDTDFNYSYQVVVNCAKDCKCTTEQS